MVTSNHETRQALIRGQGLAEAEKSVCMSDSSARLCCSCAENLLLVSRQNLVAMFLAAVSLFDSHCKAWQVAGPRPSRH